MKASFFGAIKYARTSREATGRFIVNIIGNNDVYYCAAYIVSAVYDLFRLNVQDGTDSHKVIFLKASGTVDEAGKASSESGLVDQSADADAVFFKVVSYSFFNHFLSLPFVAYLCPCPYREV